MKYFVCFYDDIFFCLKYIFVFVCLIFIFEAEHLMINCVSSKTRALRRVCFHWNLIIFSLCLFWKRSALFKINDNKFCQAYSLMENTTSCFLLIINITFFTSKSTEELIHFSHSSQIIAQLNSLRSAMRRSNRKRFHGLKNG